MVGNGVVGNGVMSNGVVGHRSVMDSVMGHWGVMHSVVGNRGVVHSMVGHRGVEDSVVGNGGSMHSMVGNWGSVVVAKGSEGSELRLSLGGRKGGGKECRDAEDLKRLVLLKFKFEVTSFIQLLLCFYVKNVFTFMMLLCWRTVIE